MVIALVNDLELTGSEGNKDAVEKITLKFCP